MGFFDAMREIVVKFGFFIRNLREKDHMGFYYLCYLYYEMYFIIPCSLTGVYEMYKLSWIHTIECLKTLPPPAFNCIETSISFMDSTFRIQWILEIGEKF